MAQFVAALKIEIARLEQQLARAKALLQSYEAAAAVEVRPPAARPNGAAELHTGAEPHIASAVGGGRSKQERVRRAIVALLREKGPTQRKVILAHLADLGLMGHESKPLRSLGAYLSRFSDDVESQGAGVWRLTEL